MMEADKVVIGGSPSPPTRENLAGCGQSFMLAQRVDLEFLNYGQY